MLPLSRKPLRSIIRCHHLILLSPTTMSTRFRSSWFMGYAGGFGEGWGNPETGRNHGCREEVDDHRIFALGAEQKIADRPGPICLGRTCSRRGYLCRHWCKHARIKVVDMTYCPQCMGTEKMICYHNNGRGDLFTMTASIKSLFPPLMQQKCGNQER